MKFLLDTGRKMLDAEKTHPDLIAGQFLTPLTSYAYLGGPFGIDNGGFTRFDAVAFRRIVKRQEEANRECLFVAVPDVVGSARRTLECFDVWAMELANWPLALVCQDGQEDLPIPWAELAAVFIGGSTDWKMSQSAADVVKTAIILGKHVHVGRVNTPARWRHFARLGAHTCDGSGVSRYDWMLRAIAENRFIDQPLLETEEAAKAAERSET